MPDPDLAPVSNKSGLPEVESKHGQDIFIPCHYTGYPRGTITFKPDLSGKPGYNITDEGLHIKDVRVEDE